ncbi:alpha-beta hydrolase superfamily lysophospholipase [Saccharothrix saharensis]|uniref:Alpha-beta hydrolase superfamily lysophospholipase n=1 Tax=Saccharothrix saharensis TaxID=571190 RepID=A0A543JNQ2_9PSEU|nr:lipase family protein [Saccharothrix saharensis]TQM84418.1 alpha-beta hydrolase superfamily lysophospholipase [Saccharothrix saharensis]
MTSSTAPDPVRRPGTLLRARPLASRFRPDHAEAAYRVFYQGVGYDGRGRLVTGSVFVPDGTPPPGGWPVVSYAHGTTGLSDRTAPSRTGLLRLERAHIASWLAAGYAVAATDYEGLATPGPHPYFHGEAVADDVVDIVRAARGLPHPLSDRWLVAGFSQGGHAALFTSLIATRYAPELDFLGTLALAPPVHLVRVIATRTSDAAAAVCPFVPIVLAGMRTRYPDFSHGFLTDRGTSLVDLAERVSLVEMFRATKAMTNDETGMTDLTRHDHVARVLDECRVPVARLDRPVFLAAGGADEIVPPAVIHDFADDIAAAGSTVHLTTYPGANHGAVLTAAHPDATRWAAAVTGHRTVPAAPAPRFDLLDATGDGYLRRDDYEVFALRLVQSFGHPPRSAAAMAVRAAYRALWRALAAESDTDDDGRVGKAEFLAWAGRATHTAFDRTLRPLATAVLALVDTNGTGVVERDEFLTLTTRCGVPDEDARTLFDRLDADHRGTVETAEIVRATREFCLDPRPGHPGHWLFGRF